MLAIETNNLTKKFKEKTAVHGINLQIKEGDYLHYWERMVQEKQQL